MIRRWPMPTIKRQYEKLKRNSICPCGSEKKYKNCCLKKINDKTQQTYEMIYKSKRIAEAKKNVAASIQHDIDHPIILPDRKVIAPSVESGKIIIP